MTKAEEVLILAGLTAGALNNFGDKRDWHGLRIYLATQSLKVDQILGLGSPRQRSDRQMNAKLVFHRYGSTYFLSQIWMAGESTGRELAQTRQERAIERELKTIASNKPAFEVVEVIAMAR